MAEEKSTEKKKAQDKSKTAMFIVVFSCLFVIILFVFLAIVKLITWNTTLIVGIAFGVMAIGFVVVYYVFLRKTIAQEVKVEGMNISIMEAEKIAREDFILHWIMPREIIPKVVSVGRPSNKIAILSTEDYNDRGFMNYLLIPLKNPNERTMIIGKDKTKKELEFEVQQYLNSMAEHPVILLPKREREFSALTGTTVEKEEYKEQTVEEKEEEQKKEETEKKKEL